ncbi:MAG: hypothetical protein MK032_07930, partial [Dehalococcoidia bacterium]|nr:hypothetical protein [Dehalococcoidia bacterium]
MIEFKTITSQNTSVEGSTFVSPTAQAIVIGTIAKREINNASFGRVTAVFERSIYLELNCSWICLADVSLGFGPLVVRVKRIYVRNWINSFSTGRLVKFSSESIR